MYAAHSANEAVQANRVEVATLNERVQLVVNRLDGHDDALKATSAETRTVAATAERAAHDAGIARRSAAAAVQTCTEIGVAATAALTVSSETRARVDAVEARVHTAHVAATSAAAAADKADSASERADSASDKSDAAMEMAGDAHSLAASAVDVASSAAGCSRRAEAKADTASATALSASVHAAAASAEAASAHKQSHHAGTKADAACTKVDLVAVASKNAERQLADRIQQLQRQVQVLKAALPRLADKDMQDDAEFDGTKPPVPTVQLNACHGSLFVGSAADELLGTLLQIQPEAGKVDVKVDGDGLAAAGSGAGAAVGGDASPTPPTHGCPSVIALRHSGVSAGGGFGKSRTAAQALHTLYTECDKHAVLYTSGMYWVTAESMATVERDVRAMALQIPSLRMLVAASTTGNELMAAVAAWLRHQDRRGWLLVLDNADDREVLSWVVSALLPPLGQANVRGHVVVTSRLSVSALTAVIPGIVAQTVEALPAAEAEKLLVEGAYGSDASPTDTVQPAEQAAIKELAGPSGVAGLPLALTHAASSVRAGVPYDSFVTYLCAFRAKRSALFGEGSRAVPGTTPVSSWIGGLRPPWPRRMVDDVVATLEANYVDDFRSLKREFDKGTLSTLGLRPVALSALCQAVEQASDAGRHCVSTTFQLSMDQVSEEAREAMRLLSLTAADGVPLSFLEAAAQHVPRLRCASMKSVLLELCRLSLVAMPDSESNVSVHRLVQRVVRDGLGESGTVYGDAVVKATALCVPDPDDDALAASAWSPWLPHVEAVVALLDADALVSPDTVGRECVEAVLSGARGHMLLGSLGMARSWLDRVQRPAADDLQRAAVSYWYGVLLWREGSYEAALAAHETSLALRQRACSVSNVQVAASLNALGVTLAAMGRSADALRKYEAALSMLQACLPPVHASIAECLHDVGAVLCAMDLHEDALAKYNEALDMRRRCLPAQHPSIADSLSSIGVVLEKTGRLPDALEKHEAALAMYETCLPAKHPSIAASLNSVGKVLKGLGRCEEALAKCEEALTMRVETLPAAHHSIAETMCTIGSAHFDMGHPEQALTHLQTALSMLKTCLPGNHPSVAECMNDVGVVLADLGRYEEALDLYASALEVRQRCLPEVHSDIAETLGNIGAALSDMGRFEEALARHKEALVMLRACLPAAHPTIAVALNNMAAAQRELGRYDEALVLYNEALDVNRKVLPPGHVSIGVMVCGIGFVLYKLERHHEAAEKLEQALQLFRDKLPPAHPFVSMALMRLGAVLQAMAQWTEALEAYEEALALRRKRLPEGDLDVAASSHAVGSVLVELKAWKKAEQFLKAAAEARLRKSKTGDADARNSMDMLKMVRKRMEANETAAQLPCRALCSF